MSIHTIKSKSCYPQQKSGLCSYTEVYSDVHCECRVPRWKRLTTVTNVIVSVLTSYARVFGDETEMYLLNKLTF